MVNITVAMLTKIAYAAAAPARPSPDRGVMEGIVKWWRVAESAGIDTPEEAAGFLGQACIETDYFKTTKEYWGPTAQQKKYDPPNVLARKLGNTSKGDGKRYMGRGIFQNTGKHNYEELSNKFDVDFINVPELVSTPEWSMKCAVDYWNSRNLGKYAMAKNYVAVSRGVNRGNPKHKSKANHEAQRLKACNAALTLFGKGAVAPKPIVMANPPKEYKGDQLVYYVQTLLDSKGWHEVGTIDGKAGKRTEGAILAYRNEHEPTLPYVTSIDQELVTALETGPDRVVAPARAEMTAAGLKEAGDETVRTVGTTNKVLAASGLLSLFGGASESGVTEKAKQALDGVGTLREMAEQALDILQWGVQHWWLALILICAVVYYYNRKVIAKRVEEHRTGKNVAL